MMSNAVAIVTGGSAGLGLEIARQFLAADYRVAIIGRSETRLTEAISQLAASFPANSDASHQRLFSVCADLAAPTAAQQAIEEIYRHWGRIDVLINNIGVSDRGTLEQLSAERLNELLLGNVLTTLLTSQAALPALKESRGVIINIGSLAGKVGARFLGGYPAAKHAVSGLTQQMRLEWREFGIHVGLLSPGPIRRQDAGQRYEASVTADANLPQQAKLPGGGTKIKGQSPVDVARRVVRMVQRREPDGVMPRYLRPLVAIGNLWPRFGDWLLLRLTSVKSKD